MPYKERKMSVDFKEILEAFEFVSFGSNYEHRAYLCRDTGKIYHHSEYGNDVEELPVDFEDEKYIEIPHKNELDLGKKLVLDFTYQFLPDEIENVQFTFNRKGAYSKFKLLLESKGKLEKWYEFESKAQEKALREWCEINSIKINSEQCH